MRRSQAQKRLVRCLRIELKAPIRTKFRINDCPMLWIRIFTRYWADMPKNNDDPRWNIILHELKGLRLVAHYCGRPKYW